MLINIPFAQARLIVMTRGRQGEVGRTSSGVLGDVQCPSLPRLVDIVRKISAARTELVN